jgi:hypothetical protein
MPFNGILLFPFLGLKNDSRRGISAPQQRGYNKKDHHLDKGEATLEQHPNEYNGISYYLVRPDDIDALDASASIFLEPGQIAFFKNYPDSLDALITQARELEALPNLAKWLESLRGIPLVMEVHTTSDTYDLSAVWLRFHIQDRDKEAGTHWWKPALNLLSFLNPQNYPLPNLLSQVYAITGEINHNGYMVAGRLRHPDRFGDEYTFYEAETGDKAFYETPEMNVFWEFHGGFYESEEERREYSLHHFEDGLTEFLNLYFACLLDKKELWVERDGSIA